RRAYFLDSSPRVIQAAASPDAILLRHTPHRTYNTAAQKAGMRAILTMPPGAGLMVNMPTGSGKSLLFQLDTLRCREQSPGACTVVITPTVSLALDHARILSRISGLEKSRALTGDLTGSQREEYLPTFGAVTSRSCFSRLNTPSDLLVMPLLKLHVLQ